MSTDCAVPAVSGGHVDLKLGCAVKEFVDATVSRVGDVTY